MFELSEIQKTNCTSLTIFEKIKKVKTDLINHFYYKGKKNFTNIKNNKKYLYIWISLNTIYIKRNCIQSISKTHFIIFHSYKEFVKEKFNLDIEIIQNEFDNNIFFSY